MTNLHTLKKKRVRIGKMIVQAREKRASRKWIEALEDARNELNYKIRKLRQQRVKKK